MPDFDATIRALAQNGDLAAAEAERLLGLAQVRTTHVPDEAKTTFGRFRLAKVLGAGGMGTVYRAWEEGLGRWVAIKMLKGDSPEDVDRFVREARTAAKLSHPNIVPIYEAGELEGKPYIAMEYIDGQDLKKRRVEMREALRIVRDAARAIQHAHERGIVHRDIKPANLMLSSEGQVFVTDFGLARTMGAPSGLSVTGDLLGTPYYMSPEQARGEKADARSDVYALGATLYELVAGRPPFEGGSMAEGLRKVLEEEPPAPRADRDVVTIVQKAMEKEPAKRYASAKDLAEDLEREMDGEPIAARPLGAVGRAMKWSKRKPAAAALIALVAAALVGVTTWAGARELTRRGAIETARARLEAGDWEGARGAASEGLAVAGDDPELPNLLRAAELLASAENLAAEEARDREDLEKARRQEASAGEGVEDWDAPERKIEKWKWERRGRELAEQIELAESSRLGLLTQVVAVTPEVGVGRRAYSEICWERFVQAESRQKSAAMRHWREEVRAYHDGRYERELRAEGRRTLASSPSGARPFLVTVFSIVQITC